MRRSRSRRAVRTAVGGTAGAVRAPDRARTRVAAARATAAETPAPARAPAPSDRSSPARASRKSSGAKARGAGSCPSSRHLLRTAGSSGMRTHGERGSSAPWSRRSPGVRGGGGAAGGTADGVGGVRVEPGAGPHLDVGGRDGEAAGGARAAGAEFGAAGGVVEVARRQGAGELGAGPGAERPQDGPEGEAALGEDVLVARGRLLVAPPFEDADLDEGLEAGGEDGAGAPRWARSRCSAGRRRRRRARGGGSSARRPLRGRGRWSTAAGRSPCRGPWDPSYRSGFIERTELLP